MLKCRTDREDAGQTAQALAVSALTLHAVALAAVLIHCGYERAAKARGLPRETIEDAVTNAYRAVAALSGAACIVAFVMFAYMHRAFTSIGFDIPPVDSANNAKPTFDMGITVMVFSIPYLVLVGFHLSEPEVWKRTFILCGPFMLILVAVLVHLMVAHSNYWYDPDSKFHCRDHEKGTSECRSLREIQDEECRATAGA